MGKERPVPANLEEQMGGVIDALRFEASDDRKTVVVHASRIIDVLTGKSDDAKRVPRDPARDLAHAPDAIPAVSWKDTITYETEEKPGWVVDVIGNIGGYNAERFHDEKPSITFNAGFYAGVLAVKMGLVKPEDFYHDSDPEFRFKNLQRADVSEEELLEAAGDIAGNPEPEA